MAEVAGPSTGLEATLSAGASTSHDPKAAFATVSTSDGFSAEVTRDKVIGILDSTLLYIANAKDEDVTPPDIHFRQATLQQTPSDSTSTPPSLLRTALPDYLDPSTRSITVIISVLSGKEHGEAVFTNLLKPFLSALGLEEPQHYTVLRTAYASSISDFTKATVVPSASLGRAQTIILLAGDGGLVDTINAISTAPPSEDFKSPTIALLPLGTGNALANSSNITSDSTLGLSTLFQGQPTPLPTFAVRFHPAATLYQPTEDEPSAETFGTVHGAVVFSWGLHAALVADSDTPEYRKYGRERFSLAAKENFFPLDGGAPHAYRGNLSFSSLEKADVAVPRDTHAYVLCTMCSQLEAGFTISPLSAPLDGQLRLVHFGPSEEAGAGVMKIMQAAYAGGTHTQMPDVGYEAVRAVRLEITEEDTRWRRVCVDGTIYVVPQGGKVEVTRDGVDSVVDLVFRK